MNQSLQTKSWSYYSSSFHGGQSVHAHVKIIPLKRQNVVIVSLHVVREQCYEHSLTYMAVHSCRIYCTLSFCFMSLPFFIRLISSCSLCFLLTKSPISKPIVVKSLHLEAQTQSSAKKHKIIPNRVFGRVLANDLGAAGRPGCLSCFYQSWIYMACGPVSPVRWWELRPRQPRLGQGGFLLS